MSTSASGNRVAVAMSGGVDSSVAALLLREQGFDLIGISMQVWDYRKNGGSASRATCCSPKDFGDARMVAGKIGIPYYVFDFEEVFATKVIDKFVSQYASGNTPNPCVECNNKVKFRALRDRTTQIGCGAVATGHYAQVALRDGKYRLMRSIDRAKDQTYFLYGISQEELSSTHFPIGHLTKTEVREVAHQNGLVTAQKAESQDICFVSGQLSDFLVQLGVNRRKGWIVNSEGRRIGQHDGIQNFTVGQRRGLNLGGFEEPLYVIKLDVDRNEVIVGERWQLEQEGFSVQNLHWTVGNPMRGQKEFDCLVQVRHRQSAVPVRLVLTGDDEIAVSFREGGNFAVPGQAAVFYTLDDREVIGGGTINAPVYK